MEEDGQTIWSEVTEMTSEALKTQMNKQAEKLLPP